MRDDPTASPEPVPAEPSPAAPAEPRPATPRLPRQRWRLVLARAEDAPEQSQRDLAASWEAAIVASGLPLAWSEGATPRPRISFGAPLPVGMAANGELVDLVLTERLPVWQVREALTAATPPGWRLVDLGDVWLGGPPLAGRVVAADHRIELAAPGPAVPGRPPEGPSADLVAAACRSLLSARRIPRERTKGSGVVTYDLRPLVADVRVEDPGPPVVLALRTRLHPELGTGRPEEVVAELASTVGAPLEVASIVRERLILAEDLV